MSVENLQPNEITPELRHFYSDDPYEVLGISNTANIEEVKLAWRELQKVFHPDTNRNPHALEISKRINIAWKKILDKETDTQKRESKKEVPRSLNDLKKYLSEAKAKGVGEKEIDVLVYSKEVQALFEKEAISIVVITAPPHNGPEMFMAFVKEWKMFGLNVENTINTLKIRSFLEFLVTEIYIDVYGRENPDMFLDLVRNWKKAGVDITDFVNGRKAQVLLENLANRHRGHPEIFRKFVQAWIKAGWIPNKRIISALDKN